MWAAGALAFTLEQSFSLGKKECSCTQQPGRHQGGTGSGTEPVPLGPALACRGLVLGRKWGEEGRDAEVCIPVWIQETKMVQDEGE